MLALGRLLRLSLAPSAAADAAAGYLIGAGGWGGGAAPWFQMLAALAVYHGGMALNDWSDREHDARTRPERPLPSGAVPAGLALALGLGLSGLGPLLAARGSLLAAGALAGVALLSVAYNLGVRGPVRGPLILGACRAGNLTAAILLGVELRPDAVPVAAAPLLLPALAYGAYVTLLSILARYEDAEAGPIPSQAQLHHPRTMLLGAALLLAVLPLPRAISPEVGALGLALGIVIAAAGAAGLLRRALRTDEWTPGFVLGSMGMGLRRLLVATSALSATVGGSAGLVAAAAILTGYPASYALRRVFPPS